MKKLFPLLVLAALSVAGCFMGGTGSTPYDLAWMSSAVNDYKEQDALAATGKLEAEDANGAVSGGGKTIYTTTYETTLPDGTVVHIERSYDDKNTPEPEDDWLTITRTWTMPDGNLKTEIIGRPPKPTKDWTTWDSNAQIIQNGTTEASIGGVKVTTGTITITWELVGGQDVVLREIDRRSTHIDRNGVIEEMHIVVDPATGAETKTSLRIRLSVDGQEIIVHSFTYEDWTDPADGLTYTKITRDDGSFAVVRQPRGPRIVDYYGVDGVRRVRVTESVDRTTGEHHVIREFFDADGNVIKTQEILITIRVETDASGEKIVVTKTFPDGKVRVISIREEESGYEVTRNGVTYHIVFDGSTVQFFDADGNLIGTVTVNPDGSWLVTMGSETTNVEL